MATKFDSLYQRSPIWIQNLALSLYGLKLRRMRYGATYERELAALRVSERFDAAQLRDLQTSKLRSLLRHALETVPHYRTAYRGIENAVTDATPSNFGARFPLLPKATVRNAADSFVSASTSQSDIATIFTSGTSGSPLPVRTTTDTIQTNYAFFARYLGWHGVTPRDHGATFAGRLIVPPHQTEPPFWRHNRATDTLLCSSYHLSERWLPAYVAGLSDYQPHFIDSYPSAVGTLAAFINRNGIDHRIRPRAVITSSETLLEGQRADIETAFGCKVRDHYGCAEMAAWITECEHGRYHVNPEFGIVEVLREDGTPCAAGEAGDMACTGFLNPTMPLIRYLIGDRAAMSEELCPCGRHFPVISQLMGRLDDQILTPDGRRVGRLDPAFKGGAGIIEAQIVQNQIDAVDVLVVAEPSFGADAQGKLIADLQHRLSQAMTIRIKVVNEIPRQRNGKFRSVVCNLKPDAK